MLICARDTDLVAVSWTSRWTPASGLFTLVLFTWDISAMFHMVYFLTSFTSSISCYLVRCLYEEAKCLPSETFEPRRNVIWRTLKGSVFLWWWESVARERWLQRLGVVAVIRAGDNNGSGQMVMEAPQLPHLHGGSFLGLWSVANDPPNPTAFFDNNMHANPCPLLRMMLMCF